MVSWVAVTLTVNAIVISTTEIKTYNLIMFSTFKTQLFVPNIIAYFLPSIDFTLLTQPLLGVAEKHFLIFTKRCDS